MSQIAEISYLNVAFADNYILVLDDDMTICLKVSLQALVIKSNVEIKLSSN